MDISPALAVALSALTDALDDPNTDLPADVHALVRDLTRAVPSFTGMTMTITLDGHDVSFTVGDFDGSDGTTTPITSLLIPFGAGTPPTGTSSTLLLRASTPGAFVDLAADLSYAMDIELSRLILDGHLAPPAQTDGVTGLDDHAAINQAIGILISRGHTPESADAELQWLAHLDHGGLRYAADAIIRSIPQGARDLT